MLTEPLLKDLADRCNTIEECYEYMLAYAGQGVAGEEGGGSQIRDFLTRAAAALTGLADAYETAVKRESFEPAAPYHAFLTVLARDAQDSLAAVELVLAQPRISSQLIDNLNASIHLRALLTDLFLIDEILKRSQLSEKPAGTV
ncbi:MAG TPA: hypothetical protein VGR73_14245 [Bryobacteraceae bacterium]|nr:hypothetical protein [Bryobacteraceae bacterium]